MNSLPNTQTGSRLDGVLSSTLNRNASATSSSKSKVEPRRWAAVLLAAILTTAAAGGDALDLAQVGAPLPGIGPVALDAIEFHSGTYVLIANYQNDDLRSLGIDPVTGQLTILGTAPTGPSALAVSGDGRHVVCTNLLSNNVSTIRLDPDTGALSPVGLIPSGGNGPAAIAISDDGYVLVANRDSDTLGILQLDPVSGELATVGAAPVGDAPTAIKISWRSVVVGHALSNDVHMLELDRFGALHPVDVQNVGARVTSVAIDRRTVVAATYPNGVVHAFNLGPKGLEATGSYSTGGDITDLEYSWNGTLFAAGIAPARVAAFELDRHGLQQVGTLALSGLSSRTLATVRGTKRATWVILNEYNNNQTLVVTATSANQKVNSP
jgi:hypothetical protein